MTEVGKKVGKMVEQPKSKSTQPRFARSPGHGPPCKRMGILSGLRVKGDAVGAMEGAIPSEEAIAVIEADRLEINLP